LDFPNLEESFIISVLDKSENGFYRALANTKKGFEELMIREEIATEGKKPFTQRIDKVLTNHYGPSIHRIKEEEAADDILNIEKRYPQVVNPIIVAVIMYKHGQSTPLELFENSKHTQKFNQFLHIMGVPEDYSLSNNKSSWHDKTVVWYLASKMTEEEQRRFIGNTMGVIFYVETEEPFDHQLVRNMGSMLQFCIVVKPHRNYFRLGCIYRDTMKSCGTEFPANYLFDANILRDFLLAKVHNCYFSTRMYPPINKLFEMPRGSAVREVAEKYTHKATWRQYISSPRKSIT